ncbi:hypothetical protein ACFU99_07645 [Streptomyces sp. NPDC057654]|uniref:hypothetical protein n=1 Tax=Streptomyces sp. NPDC057654 TaxID=3346196 RepID=UPI0036AF4BA5
MADTCIHPADPFAEHYVDLTHGQALTTLASQLSDRGLATRSAVRAAVTRIMELIPHQDSDPDGLTTIRNTTRLAHCEEYTRASAPACP